MEIKEIYQKLLTQFGETVILSLTEAQEGIRDPFITVDNLQLANIANFLLVDPELRCDFCQSLTAQDTGETLTAVYHLYSYAHHHTVTLKTTAPRQAPHLPSLTGIWPAADWYEREAYDLFGINFVGHPDLRRLLLPDDWEGYPMRKDWQEKSHYNNIPTSRPSPLDLLDEKSPATREVQG